MNDEVQRILVEILGIGPGDLVFTPETGLLGSLPEFDSMAAVSILTAIEDRFGVVIDDDDIDASIFETVGTLTAFIAAKTDA